MNVEMVAGLFGYKTKFQVSGEVYSYNELIEKYGDKDVYVIQAIAPDLVGLVVDYRKKRS